MPDDAAGASTEDLDDLSHQRLKSRAEDLLLSRGYFLLDGQRQGADIVAYRGIPGTAHGDLLVFLTSGHERLEDLMGYNRLSSSVKKSALMFWESGERLGGCVVERLAKDSEANGSAPK